MFEYLQPADKPVAAGLEAVEVVYAKDQPQYIPLRSVCSTDPQRKVMSRWTLTAEQRKAVAAGADIFLTLLTFGHPLQPITMAVCDHADNGSFADWIRMEFGLPTKPKAEVLSQPNGSA